MCVREKDFINLTVVFGWSRGKRQRYLVIITCQLQTHMDDLQDTTLTTQTTRDVTVLLSNTPTALAVYFKEPAHILQPTPRAK